MSHFVEGNFKTFTVGNADIPAGSAVKLGTSGNAGKIVVAAAATDKILGTINSKAYAGNVIDVHLRSASGTTNIKVNGSTTIAAGDNVTSNGSGLGVTTTTSGDQIIGIAVEAGAVNAFVELLPSTAKV